MAETESESMDSLGIFMGCISSSLLVELASLSESNAGASGCARFGDSGSPACAA
jgi:hypothetical protein